LPEKFIERKKVPAGWLIEQCGLKNQTVGGAKVSEQHANMVINCGGATAADVVTLINLIKEKVKNKFDLELSEEIIIIGF